MEITNDHKNFIDYKTSYDYLIDQSYYKITNAIYSILDSTHIILPSDCYRNVRYLITCNGVIVNFEKDNSDYSENISLIKLANMVYDSKD
jgi:regulator of extracellular matrix RemA (YlzA/DUF370 family)